MKKQKGQNKNYHLLILLGVLLITVLFLFDAVTKNNQISNDRESQSTISPTPNLKTYHSDFLGLTFEYPAEYEVEDGFTNTIVINSKITNQIKIERLFTNATNLEDYLAIYDSRRSLDIVQREDLQIAGYYAVARTQKFIGGTVDQERIYFIYTENGTVYAFSTSSENLYPDLDQITRSFRFNQNE